ncbi:MAG: hypothetical protein EOM92_21870 [Gammaproteobacteria bacterium]|jgi:hypothetical protein|nr:hypothetical protein [Gammaproteobacteria bacterium]
MKARQLFRFKDRQGELILDMVLWALPAPDRYHPHGLKYRLYCGRSGECLVRYDNETGKGDHRHYGDREEPYSFTSVEQLLTDFRGDCTRLAGWRWL